VNLRVFDTSFIIDLTLEDLAAVKLAREMDSQGSVAAISAISVHEYIVGVYMKYLGSDEEILNSKLEAAEKLLLPFVILPFTGEIARESARIEAELSKRGQMIGINDVYIAATALTNRATVTTRNAAHFARVSGLSVEKY
jgi:tRNA(fMet)-specific endonuclease VapC